MVTHFQQPGGGYPPQPSTAPGYGHQSWRPAPTPGPKAPSGPVTIGGTGAVLAMVVAAIAAVTLAAALDDGAAFAGDAALFFVVYMLLLGAVFGLIIGWIAFAVRRSSYRRRYAAYASHMQALSTQSAHPGFPHPPQY